MGTRPSVGSGRGHPSWAGPGPGRACIRRALGAATYGPDTGGRTAGRDPEAARWAPRAGRQAAPCDPASPEPIAGGAPAGLILLPGPRLTASPGPAHRRRPLALDNFCPGGRRGPAGLPRCVRSRRAPPAGPGPPTPPP